MTLHQHFISAVLKHFCAAADFHTDGNDSLRIQDYRSHLWEKGDVIQLRKRMGLSSAKSAENFCCRSPRELSETKISWCWHKPTKPGISVLKPETRILFELLSRSMPASIMRGVTPKSASLINQQHCVLPWTMLREEPKSDLIVTNFPEMRIVKTEIY